MIKQYTLYEKDHCCLRLFLDSDDFDYYSDVKMIIIIRDKEFEKTTTNKIKR